MNHLILYAHPNPNSFNGAIMQLVQKTLEEKGDAVRVRDLYKENFNPSLSATDFTEFSKNSIPKDIKIEQEHIAWADSIIVIYPLWWGSMPAILKGYFDRVFSLGFAYATTESGVKPLLTGKKGLFITTLGNSEEAYLKLGVFEAIETLTDVNIFEFSGIKTLNHTFFTSVPYIGDDDRAKYLEETKNLIKELY